MTHFRFKHITQLKVKKWQQICHETSNQKTLRQKLLLEKKGILCNDKKLNLSRRYNNYNI